MKDRSVMDSVPVINLGICLMQFVNRGVELTCDRPVAISVPKLVCLLCQSRAG